MKYALLLLMLLLVGCATTTQTVNTSDTMRIIEAAAEAAPQGVSGEFELFIQASGRDAGVLYLNTEKDYRDPRNVSIAIHPAVAQSLEQQFEQSPDEFFLNKTVRVRGEAKTVQIFFSAYGRQSRQYYFQTHVGVTRPEQIEVL